MAEFEHDSELYGHINLDTLAGVQDALVKLGYDPGKVDGIDGPKTQGAVREFQGFAQIKVDGIVGPETRGALVAELQTRVEAESNTGGETPLAST